jgi:hypothetical protein
MSTIVVAMEQDDDGPPVEATDPDETVGLENYETQQNSSQRMSTIIVDIEQDDGTPVEATDQQENSHMESCETEQDPSRPMSTIGATKEQDDGPPVLEAIDPEAETVALELSETEQDLSQTMSTICATIEQDEGPPVLLEATDPVETVFFENSETEQDLSRPMSTIRAAMEQDDGPPVLQATDPSQETGGFENSETEQDLSRPLSMIRAAMEQTDGPVPEATGPQETGGSENSETEQDSSRPMSTIRAAFEQDDGPPVLKATDREETFRAAMEQTDGPVVEATDAEETVALEPSETEQDSSRPMSTIVAAMEQDGLPVEAKVDSEDQDDEDDSTGIQTDPEELVVLENSETEQEVAATVEQEIEEEDVEDNLETEVDGGADDKFETDKDEDNEDEDDEDEDDEDEDDEDYIDLDANERKSRTNPLCLFTTGLGFSVDDKSRLKAVIESAASKNKFCDTFVPHPSLFGLVYRWARRPAYNFAADVLNSNHVVAREVGFSSAFQLCNLRGWILTRHLRSKVPFLISYKRFHECLKQGNFPPDHRALHLLGIVQSAYDSLETSVLPAIPSASAMKAAKTDSTKSESKSLSAAKKRKSVRASPAFELIHAHDPSSFQQRLTQNTKCLQIALFLIDFIFASTVPVETVDAKTKLYFSMFSACYSSRRFVELCHGLLVFFDGPTPDPDKVHQLSKHVLGPDSNINLLDYVSGKVSFGHAQTMVLRDKIHQEIATKFPKTSAKNYTKRKKGDQLVIMRYVVLSMFIKYKGNEIDNTTKSVASKPNSAIRKALTDPMVVGNSLLSTVSSISGPPQKQRRIEVDHPTLLDVLATAAPNNLDQHRFAQSMTIDSPIPPPPYESYYSDMEKRFDPKQCRMATTNEIAPFAPRVYVEGDLFETNLYCAPLEFYLLRDLKNRNHGFKCDDLGLQPSVSKCSASLDIPMVVSLINDDTAIIRPGHAIFVKAFAATRLHVDLPLCLKFVIKHGTSNRARDGVVSSGSMDFGSRIDFGCAGSGSTKIAPGVWRPDQLCGLDVFEKVSQKECSQIKACLASVYDCIQVASDEIQKEISLEPLFNYQPRDKVYGSILRNFLGAKIMRNEWMTLQVKCISRGDRTDRHKDIKNCSWRYYNKTGALCFVISDAFGTLWSLKFISNGRLVIGSYFDKLLGVETLCTRIKTHFKKLDLAYATFLLGYEGSYTPSTVLNWKNPWGFFLDARCNWTEVKDTGQNKIFHRCIVLPTIVVRDFWLSAPVHIITEMKSLGLQDDKLLELILLGAYQTSWFRFFYVGMKMVKGKKTNDPFKTYIQLAVEAFGSITGGPKPRADPPGIDVKAVYYPDNCSTKHKVIKTILGLLTWVNDTPPEKFNHVAIREMVLLTAKSISRIKAGAELGEFRLMLILQMCALSSVVLRPSPKLLNLLYPIPGKGSANHLLDVSVKEADHHDALRRVSHHFNLKQFGDNAGESILCETLPGRNVFDAFFPLQSLFLLNAHGKPMRKKYSTTKWDTVEDIDEINMED